jgi:hypothetical protein
MPTGLRFAIVLLLLLTMARSGSAADRDTLKGLRAVDVRIEDVAPEAERDGLATSQLRTDIESQLAQAGIQISEDAAESFYLNVNAHRSAPNEMRYMYNIELRVSQPVLVIRTDAVELAGTWSRAILGTSMLAVLSDSVRGDVRQLVTTFLNDYLAVNPKP